MPLVLAPSFDDHTRAEVEAHLEQVRIRRLAAVIEYQRSKMQKLQAEDIHLETRLKRNYEQLGKALVKLDTDLSRVETYLQACTMLSSELGLVHDRIKLAEK